MSTSSTDHRTFVIVGGGLAAATAAATLREEGFDGRLVLLAAERHLPYERPPLSKGYLAGEATLADATVHPADFYETHGVELRLGTPATALDVDAHTVTAGDETITYDRLLLATGSSARRLPLADDSGAPVAYLRTIDDAERIAAALRERARLVVVGGGWIGLEVAAAARAAGCDVVVVEPLEEPLLRVLGPQVGHAFAQLHRRHGVDVRTGTSVEDITTAGAPGVALVRLGDGTTVEADLVLVGIGAVPSTTLAEKAGLKVDDGVMVDEHLRSSHPDVVVAGDIARAHHPLLGQHVRVEHWDTALGQGAAAARTMLGTGEPYERLPYFFTDQYELGMEYVGYVDRDGFDELVVRGDLDGVYLAFWVRQGRVLAAMHTGDWDAMDDLRAVVRAGAVDLDRLRDPQVPLGDVLG
ncbi:NAD(P)/FAD-dependent oxidoreductase [Actinotalea sp. Marseille-Q4924]|uniref:NAD(P)/FAD-dependent oxidoreductase n=1 Tax=Actinotalea sp. Marseille-Q4924 TaxID=2866571 RepID=UPI001CE4920A|nr:FAD-dependent oxidoreductase [Actinotalea sp. Marseille-Q4924]